MKKVYKKIGISVLLFTLSVNIFPANAALLGERLSGRILLQVESYGEAWYINPTNTQRYYMGRPADAYALMRELGLGITNTDLNKIPIAGDSNVGDQRLVNRLLGRILLQVEEHGEAWYINPVDEKRYYLGRAEDAYTLMRELGLGITNADLESIGIARGIPEPAATPQIEQAPTVNTIIQEAPELPGPLPVVIGDEQDVSLSSEGIFSETNKHRTQHGLPAFRESPELNEAALKKVQDMAAQNYFDHVSPEGKDIGDLAGEVGYAYVVIGENIAVGNTFTDVSVLEGWMNSPGHRANILNDRFTELGVAAAQGVYQGKQVWFAAQEFGKPKSDCPSVDMSLDAIISQTESELDEIYGYLEDQKLVLEAYGAVDTSNPEEVKAYNNDQDVYNALVDAYNTKRKYLIAIIDQFNSQVNAYNACVT